MSSGPILDAPPPIYAKLELTEVGINVMIKNKYLHLTNDSGSWARAWCYFFSGDVRWKDQMFFRMSMIRFCYDESDPTKWIEKKSWMRTMGTRISSPPISTLYLLSLQRCTAHLMAMYL